VPYNEHVAYIYADAVIRSAEHYNERFDTIYFGGGTPSLAWWNICRIMSKLRFSDDAEITIEANPNTLTKDALSSMKNSGINRLSIGVQSFSNAELGAISRGHTSEDAQHAIRMAQECGFRNISVDLMLGIPNQTPDSVRRSIKVLAGLDVQHVSAYMLKIEPRTPFAHYAPSLKLPDEDATIQIYLAAVSALEDIGFKQYEISNFAKRTNNFRRAAADSSDSFECRHNLKYWRSEEYLGIGAGAHSYYGGERFYVEKNLTEFINPPVQQVVVTHSEALSFDDFAMMKLRLTEGLRFTECKRFGVHKAEMLRRARLVPREFLDVTEKYVAMTKEGFLVSNQIIGKLTTNG
jgi:oxygen-independent coproporphyrinogen-3 oxidase